MQISFARGVLVFCLMSVAAQVLPAQPAASEDFADLARRAEAALDSRPAEAASLYRKAVVQRPDWAEGWLYLGAALYQTGRYAEASDAFRKGIALNPGQGNAWAFLGLCEAELDDPDQALSDIRKGEELGLGDNQQFALAVRVRAARLLIAGSDFDDAMAQLYPLAKLQEDSPAVVETMGLVVLGRGVQSIGALPAREREVVRAAGKAAWLAACQHPAEAAAAYKDLVAQYAGEPGVHYAIGLYLMETDLAAALEEFQKETQANPKHWPALIAGGTVQVRRGDAAAALLSLRQALQSAPAKYRWLCHSELGRAQMLAENVDAAVTELESAVRLMPAIPQVHFFLSQAYRRAGRAADAKRENAEFERLKAQQDPLGVPGLRGLGGK